jgi:predicted acyl esterase
VSLSHLSGSYEVTREDDVAMRTRDGKVLRADVYRPVGAPATPVLLRRTPYGKRQNDLALAFNEAHYFASHGYTTVVQDTRGRFSSEGAWYPFAYEARDGYDAIEWAAALPGTTGRVGTLGQSYGALSQYLAARPSLRNRDPCLGAGRSAARSTRWVPDPDRPVQDAEAPHKVASGPPGRPPGGQSPARATERTAGQGVLRSRNRSAPHATEV